MSYSYNGEPGIITPASLTPIQVHEVSSIPTTKDLDEGIMRLAAWHELEMFDWDVVGVCDDAARTIRREARARAARGRLTA